MRRLINKMRRLIKISVAFYRRLPFKPFKAVLKKVYSFYRSINRNGSVVAKVDGIIYELDLNEQIDSAIYYDGYFEKYTTNAINNLCKKGMTVLDIGANIGCHTFRFAKLVGSTGKVIAFEPTSWAFQKLKRNMELNDFTNVVLENIALSNENKDDQEVRFFSSWPLHPSSYDKIHSIHGGLDMRDVVRFVTLDDYVKRYGIKKIDFIKLDVDGYEYKVIQGAIETLKLHKPTMIIELVEYTHKEVGDNIFEMVSLLSDLGYNFYFERDMQKLGIDLVKELLLKGEGFNAILTENDL